MPLVPRSAFTTAGFWAARDLNFFCINCGVVSGPVIGRLTSQIGWWLDAFRKVLRHDISRTERRGHAACLNHIARHVIDFCDITEHLEARSSRSKIAVNFQGLLQQLL